MSAGPLGFEFDLKPMGDTAILARLRYPPGVEGLLQMDAATRQARLLEARRLALWLEKTAPEREYVSGYDSVLIPYNPQEISFPKLKAWLEEQIAALKAAEEHGAVEEKARRHRIPVVYGGQYGPDLEEVARIKGLTPEEVVLLHSSAIYSAYLVGFAPGFTYLGALPPEIDVPRRSNPRPKVPARSVAMAAGLTGVYPATSPGGWWLLGYTPLSMFEVGSDPPVRFLPGDEVQFFPISAGELAEYAEQEHDLASSLKANPPKN